MKARAVRVSARPAISASVAFGSNVAEDLVELAQEVVHGVAEDGVLAHPRPPSAPASSGRGRRPAPRSRGRVRPGRSGARARGGRGRASGRPCRCRPGAAASARPGWPGSAAPRCGPQGAAQGAEAVDVLGRFGEVQRADEIGAGQPDRRRLGRQGRLGWSAAGRSVAAGPAPPGRRRARLRPLGRRRCAGLCRGGMGALPPADDDGAPRIEAKVAITSSVWRCASASFVRSGVGHASGRLVAVGLAQRQHRGLQPGGFVPQLAGAARRDGGDPDHARPAGTPPSASAHSRSGSGPSARRRAREDEDQRRDKHPDQRQRSRR